MKRVVRGRFLFYYKFLFVICECVLESKVWSFMMEFYNKSLFIEIEGRIDGWMEELSVFNLIYFGFLRWEFCLFGLGVKCFVVIYWSYIIFFFILVFFVL